MDPATVQAFASFAIQADEFQSTPEARKIGLAIFLFIETLGLRIRMVSNPQGHHVTLFEIPWHKLEQSRDPLVQFHTALVKTFNDHLLYLRKVQNHDDS